MLSLLYLVVKTQQYFVSSSCMFLGDKTSSVAADPKVSPIGH